jgi:tocopherol cyclase
LGWPVTLTAPGIMGWYAAMPFMECYHGLVSFNHGLQGELEVLGSVQSFSGGKGYIEKDWGKAFPAGYIWIHSNHLAQDSSASLVASVAIIPWLGGSSFRGFIMGLRHHNKLYQWSTPNRSKELELEVTDSQISWKVSGKDGTLELIAQRQRGGLLHAPMRTAMHQRVEETMDATIIIRHTLSDGSVFESPAEVGCMEVFGDIDRMLEI